MADERISEDRPLRICDICGQTDDHPRHVVGLADGGTRMAHMDCCRVAGCPDGTCNEVTKGAEKKKGATLLTHLTGGK